MRKIHATSIAFQFEIFGCVRLALQGVPHDASDAVIVVSPRNVIDQGKRAIHTLKAERTTSYEHRVFSVLVLQCLAWLGKNPFASLALERIAVGRGLGTEIIVSSEQFFVSDGGINWHGRDTS